jgi:hypothetical protein
MGTVWKLRRAAGAQRSPAPALKATPVFWRTEGVGNRPADFCYWPMTLIKSPVIWTKPWAFVAFAAMIFLTWGKILSPFPSTCTDTFGPKFATANLSLLYTLTKGASALFAPVTNLIKRATGSWHMVFLARRS